MISCDDLVDVQEINAVDTSNLKIIRANDTHAFYNGSIKFLIGFKKLPGRFFYEKFHNGEWLMSGFSGRYGNFCFTYHDRTQPFFYYMDHFPKCPVEAGVSLILRFTINFGSDRGRIQKFFYIDGKI